MLQLFCASWHQELLALHGGDIVARKVELQRPLPDKGKLTYLR